MGEPSKEASNQAIQQAFEALPDRCANAMEPRPAVLPGVDAIEHQHVQVDIQRALGTAVSPAPACRCAPPWQRRADPLKR